MNDTESTGGYSMGDKGVHSTRIDDQLEARIGLAECTSESTDIRLFIGSKTVIPTPVACCVAAPMTGQSYGPFGGPSFGPFGGPVFGFKAVPDRWSEIGTQTHILNPSLRGTEYSTPVGLQFYSPLWSQMEYQTQPCITCKQVESDRWSGRWHGTGSTGTGSCVGVRTNAAGKWHILCALPCSAAILLSTKHPFSTPFPPSFFGKLSSLTTLPFFPCLHCGRSHVQGRGRDPNGVKNRDGVGVRVADDCGC